jgi:hypothetical protein
MQDQWGIIISAGGLLIVVLSAVGGLVWRLSRIEIAIRNEYTEEVAAIRAEHAREIASLSAKLYQVEIWARDEFVRKGSFETVIARMEKGFGDLRNEIAQRLDKMTDRIEHIVHTDR